MPEAAAKEAREHHHPPALCAARPAPLEDARYTREMRGQFRGAMSGTWGRSSAWTRAWIVGALFGMHLSATPAAGAQPDAARPAADDADAGAARVIFTGFVRRTNQSATIFVRLTGEVPVTVEQSGRRFVYRLEGAKLGVPNSGNPLPTEHFGPPVSHVALVPHAGGVDLVIDLTRDPGPEAPKHRFAKQGALSTLHVDLPAPPR